MSPVFKMPLISEEKINVFQNYIQIEKDLSNVSENYIVYAGRVSHEKGIATLIEAFLASNLKDTKLKIVGDGPYLNEAMNKYNTNLIEFCGQKSNYETLEIIKKSKAVLTATKLFEGQPTLLCEASSFGVPSIFPDTGGISEFFPSNYELMYDRNEIRNLTEKINLLENNEYIEDIGIKNKEYLKSNLNEDRLIDIFNKIINEL